MSSSYSSHRSPPGSSSHRQPGGLLLDPMLHGYTLGSTARPAGTGDTVQTERAAPTDPAGHDQTHRDSADTDRVRELPPSIWPAGPGVGNGSIRPVDLETIVTTMLRDAAIMGDERPGLTRKRLAAILPEIWREQTQPLLAWFEAAGLLEPPRDPGQPWRTPRPLVSTVPDQIAERLRTTPRPSV